MRVRWKETQEGGCDMRNVIFVLGAAASGEGHYFFHRAAVGSSFQERMADD